MQEIKSRTRRNLLKSGIGLATGTAVAGCIDEPETSSEPVDTDESETGDEQQSQGLQLNFTWNDILQAETQFYERQATVVPTGSDKTALEAANPNHIQNADLTDYNEFQDALVTTLNEIVHYQGERTDGDSSSMTGSASAATNLILQEELENNETYQEQGLDIKMIPLGYSGHGYTQAASTEHELTLVDSNTENVGPATERPLQDRRNSGAQDYVGQFSMDKLIGNDYEALLNRNRYIGFPINIYQSNGDGREDIRITLDNVEEFYENAVLADNGLFMGPVRDSVATLATMNENNYFNDEYIAITSAPTELPSREDYETLGEYAEELTENHIEVFDSPSEFEEITMAPDGYSG